MPIYIYAAYIVALLLILSLTIIIKGPSDWHRLQGFALFSSKTVILIVLLSMSGNQAFILDLALVYSLLGFISAILLARYVSKRRQL